MTPGAAPETSATIATTPVELTKDQTIALLAVSRHEPFPLQPQMRKRFLRTQLIAPVGSEQERSYEVTQRGHISLAWSPHLKAAQDALDSGRGVP